jgi:hypothetical protein
MRDSTRLTKKIGWIIVDKDNKEVFDGAVFLVESFALNYLNTFLADDKNRDEYKVICRE